MKPEPLPPLGEKPRLQDRPLCIICIAAGLAIGLIIYLVWHFVDIGLWP